MFDAQLQGDESGGRLPGGRDWVDLVRSTKPIVAAVNGAAIGIGLTMILPFDRIVVADGAKLSIRFVKLGLVPELASTMFLPLRCGWGAASDLMLSGRTLLAARGARTRPRRRGRSRPMRCSTPRWNGRARTARTRHRSCAGSNSC